MSDPLIDDTIERLAFEFAAQLPVHTIGTVVRRAQHDLDTCPVAALPELVERLARQRLMDVLPTTAAPAG